jgi:hypothetical protein
LVILILLLYDVHLTLCVTPSQDQRSILHCFLAVLGHVRLNRASAYQAVVCNARVETYHGLRVLRILKDVAVVHAPPAALPSHFALVSCVCDGSRGSNALRTSPPIFQPAWIIHSASSYLWSSRSQDPSPRAITPACPDAPAV